MRDAIPMQMNNIESKCAGRVLRRWDRQRWNDDYGGGNAYSMNNLWISDVNSAEIVVLSGRK
jgi:hypothetical protein